MLPTAPSPPRARAGGAPSPSPLDWRSPTVQAFGAGMALMLFLGRAFRPGCPPPALPTPALALACD